MTEACQRLRAALFRVAEGEASPDEALLAAQHLPTCTGCRILLHREHRLAGLLEELADPLGVDDAFLSHVMGAIPAEPPPRRRRLLRAVGGVGVLALLALLWSLRPATGGGPVGSLPLALPDLQGGERLAGGLAGLAQFLSSAAAQAGASLAPALPSIPRLHLLALAVVPLLGVGLAVGSMLLLFAAHSVMSGFPGRGSGEGQPVEPPE